MVDVTLISIITTAGAAPVSRPANEAGGPYGCEVA
jgi:hypothetical protein